MRITSFVFVIILLSACRQGGQANETATDTLLPKTDTIVGRKTITNEIAGAAYRKRAIGYFVITNSDTSAFTCILEESKVGGKVAMDLYFKQATTTYSQRMTELRTILREARKDFALDSLHALFLGRLIFNGDIAIDVTNQYRERFGDTEQRVDYKIVSPFLAQSKLATDLNEVLRPYSISVARVYPEKLFFTTQEELYWASKIETDSLRVPEKILDCMTWVEFGRKK